MKKMVRCSVLLCVYLCLGSSTDADKPLDAKRTRDLGIEIGIFQPGPYNAITDVSGVKVGHVTLIRGDTIRTGVTAILPHGGNLFQHKVPGAVFIGNAFGKIIGAAQVNELGEIETPILLTSTLSAPKVADALLTYMLALNGNEAVLSMNPLVAETNDGYLNDSRARVITTPEVIDAITSAKSGEVSEGVVGAGTGTVAFGYKGGIGTASRQLPNAFGGYTVGVLVQSNFGGQLQIAGIPLEQALKQAAPPADLATFNKKSKGSIIIVVATDAPLDHRNLKRLAARAMLGLGRTGSNEGNGSGDFVIAFSTAESVRISNGASFYQPGKLVANDLMTPLFEAVIEATEEAIDNSLLMAHSVSGNGHSVPALPKAAVISILQQHGVLHR